MKSHAEALAMFPVLLTLGLAVSRPPMVRYTDDMTLYRSFRNPPTQMLEVLPNGRLAPSVTLPALQTVLQSLKEKNDPKSADLIKGLEKVIEEQEAVQKKAAPKK